MTGRSHDPIGGKQIRFGEELFEVVPCEHEELLDFAVRFGKHTVYAVSVTHTCILGKTKTCFLEMLETV